MKKIVTLFICVILVLSFAACGSSEKTSKDDSGANTSSTIEKTEEIDAVEKDTIVADYDNTVDFETALNNGEDVIGKIAIVSVKNIEPDSAFGYNLQAGEHLNFCSDSDPDVEVGEIITVRVGKVATVLNSYIISYEFLEKKQGSVDSDGETQEDNQSASSELLPIEVKEYGCSMNNEYVYCSVNLYNPNVDKAIELPRYRIVARNEAGELLGTEDQTLSIIYPQQNFVHAFLAFDVAEDPASVEIEVLEPEDYNVKDVSTLDNPEYIPLKIEGAKYSNDRILGEIQNDNDYNLDNVIVTVVFRDDNGKLIGGTSTFVDSVKAKSKTPFDMSIYEKFATSNFEVYANIW